MKRWSLVLFVALPLLLVAGVIANKVRTSWQAAQTVPLEASSKKPDPLSPSPASRPVVQPAKPPVDKTTPAQSKLATDAAQTPNSENTPKTTSANLVDGALSKDEPPSAAAPEQTAQPSDNSGHASTRAAKPTLPPSQTDEMPRSTGASRDTKNPPANAPQQPTKPAIVKLGEQGSSEKPIHSVRAPADAAPSPVVPAKRTVLSKAPTKVPARRIGSTSLTHASRPPEQGTASPPSPTALPKKADRPARARVARSQPVSGSNGRSSQYRPLAISPAPSPVQQPQPFARPSARPIYQGQR